MITRDGRHFRVNGDLTALAALAARVSKENARPRAPPAHIPAVVFSSRLETR